MRVFLDVGAHEGQTLDEVLKPEYRFDWVWAFEPMPTQFAQLVKRYGWTPDLTLCNYGLAAHTGRVNIYGTNDRMEASIYPTKNDVDPATVTECDMVEASHFFASLPPDADVTVKLNCEGAEVDILDNLIDTGEIWKVGAMLVDFDIRKVDGQKHREHAILRRLAKIRFDRFGTEWPAGNTHQERIGAWLSG